MDHEDARSQVSQYPKPQIEIPIEAPPNLVVIQLQLPPPSRSSWSIFVTIAAIKVTLLSILASLHAGYFRITMSLCGQALLLKTLKESTLESTHLLGHVLRLIPSSAFYLLWSLALFSLATLSFLYLLRCIFHFNLVKSEFLHHVGVNYLFAPWISWLLLLQSSPFMTPTSTSTSYPLLWCLLVAPVLALDVKIYGQWFTKGKRFLSTVANPTSLLSVVGNLVAARTAAEMGWRESAICMFSLGMSHYLVLFVTLYQRLSGGNSLPAMLRPVFFLFFAAPSMASLAWCSICGYFDVSSKMLLFLSMFLFFSLVSRPTLFKKSMRTFNVTWWAYSFPLTVLALASVDYETEVKNNVADGIMLVLTSLSVFVTLALMVLTALNTNAILPDTNDPILGTNTAINEDTNPSS